ncbi:MAG: hypothetical protein [Siphoviridae sp. ctpQM7]|nr:MAG: hypothetical protein [Siphoviridae sp. ctpQM7]
MTGLTKLFLGGISAALASTSLWVVGSLSLQGHLFFDAANSVTTPTIYSETGALMTFVATQGLPGGGTRFFSSGSDVLLAQFQIPTTYSSGALLEQASVECGNISRSMSGSLIVSQFATKQGHSVGTAVRTHVFIGTGSSVTINSGQLLNAKIRDSGYVTFITNSSGGAVLPASYDCVLKARIREKYGR